MLGWCCAIEPLLCRCGYLRPFEVYFAVFFSSERRQLLLLLFLLLLPERPSRAVAAHDSLALHHVPLDVVPTARTRPGSVTAAAAPNLAAGFAFSHTHIIH